MPPPDQDIAHPEILSAFVKIHVWFITAALAGMFAWVWNTEAQVRENKATAEAAAEAIRSLPKIQTDLAVIQDRQGRIETDIETINKKLDRLIDEKNHPERRVYP